MENLALQEILEQAHNMGASDIHLTAGKAVVYRIDGELIELEGAKLTPQDIEAFALPLFKDNERLVNEFENMSQIKKAVEQGGIIDSVSEVIDVATKKSTKCRDNR